MNAGRSSAFISFTLAALSWSAYAQSASSSLASLSSGCQTAASSLLASNIATCAQFTGLLGIATASGSIIDPLNSWITGVCGQTCAQSDLDAAKATVVNGCSSDLASGNDIAESLLVLTSNYTQVKDLLCLQATSNSSFCVTTFLQNAQAATGKTLDIATLGSLFGSDILTLESLFNQIPTSQVCSDCDKAFLIKTEALISPSEAAKLNSAASGKCGAAFVDGNMPSDVKEGTGSNSSGANSGATVLKVSGGLLAAAAGVMTLL